MKALRSESEGTGCETFTEEACGGKLGDAIRGRLEDKAAEGAEVEVAETSHWNKHAAATLEDSSSFTGPPRT